MIKETTVEYLFGTASEYIVSTFWSNRHISINAINMQDALKRLESIIPYTYALGPSVVKLEKKGTNENNKN